MPKLNTAPIDEVVAYFIYDKKTGFIHSAVPRANNKVKAGQIVGHPCSKGYLQVSMNGKLFSAHRVAWVLHYGYWPDCQIDHIDRNPSNNRIENLRLCRNGNFDNSQNQSRQKNNTSGHIGINLMGGYWRVRLAVNGKRMSFGLFKTIADAIDARNKAVKQFHPFAT